MDRQPVRQVISQFLAASLSLVLFVATMTGAIVFLFGSKFFSEISSSEANAFASIELNQLVGTADYRESSTSRMRSAVDSLLARLPVPLSNPKQILESVLPQTATQVLNENGSQSSLMSSISTWAIAGNKIAMGWLPATTSAASIQLMQDAPGINVVSPSWFELQDASGNISVGVLPSVVQYAHQHHIKVWAMVDNQFSSTLTHSVLQNPRAEQNLVDELVLSLIHI